MTYRGFDTSTFPGLAAMDALKPDFDWVGFYLRAPSHQDRSWCGQRLALALRGWGLAPIFVGQETLGPGSHVITAAQGALDGDACTARMLEEGFPPGSTVYVDLENGPPFGSAESVYVKAIASAIRVGGFRPGVYCSHTFADAVRALVPDVALWVFKVPTTERTTAQLPITPPDPTGVCAGAVALQFRQNVVLNGLLMDLDSSTVPNPSAP